MLKNVGLILLYVFLQELFVEKSTIYLLDNSFVLWWLGLFDIDFVAGMKSKFMLLPLNQYRKTNPY